MSTTRGATLVSPPSSYPSPEGEISQNPHLFLEKLKTFHISMGSSLRIPAFGGSQLDLHSLFVEVTSRGGMEKVTKDRKWKEVSSSLKCPSSITSASFILKKHYQSLLYHFEEVYYFRKSAPSLLATASSAVQPGSLLMGTVDENFDSGYSVTVDMGSEKWHGVIFHAPSESDQDPTLSGQSQNETRDPTKFEDSGGGFRLFQSFMFKKLQPFYGNEVTAIRKKIWVIWGSLSEAQKQVYRSWG